mgnify:CR=1 FL=1
MPFSLRQLLAPAPNKLQRDVLELELDDGRRLSVQRVRDPRARRLKLSVDERGARLTLPLRASLAAGDRFLHEHRHWLAAQLQRQAPDPVRAAGLQPGSTASLPLRGQELPLLWRPGRYLHLQREDAGIVVQQPERASAAALRRALRGFYEAEARADIGRWLPAYLPGLPRAPRQVRLKIMSSQWGSLAADGSMALDLALVLGRPSAFEYVLVHELCHLLQANHSPAFWHEVEQRFPAWREERRYFHQHGRQLKASLRALLAD